MGQNSANPLPFLLLFLSFLLPFLLFLLFLLATGGQHFQDADFARGCGSAQTLLGFWAGSVAADLVRWYMGPPQYSGAFVRFADCHYLLLPSFDGHVIYRPNRVMRQFDKLQDVLVLDQVPASQQHVGIRDTSDRQVVLDRWTSVIHIAHSHTLEPTDSLATHAYVAWMGSGGLAIAMPALLAITAPTPDSSSSEVLSPTAARWKERFQTLER